jgi:GMP synthase-like glutamine amidotransferase
MLSENHYTDLDREAGMVEEFHGEQAHYVADMFPRDHKILCIDNSVAPSKAAKKNDRELAHLPRRIQDLFFAIQKGYPLQPGTVALFRNLMGYKYADDRFRVWQPYNGTGVEYAQDLSEYSAIVATGSSAMATDHGETDWMQQMCSFLEQREALKIPSLFVCFTHQLEAHRSGGNVEWISDPKGRNVREFGISVIDATEEKNKSTFFTKLPDQLVMPASHSQQVQVAPPKGAVTYSNAVSRVQALSYDDVNAWTIQNHPEVLASTLSTILMMRHETIGQEIDMAGQEMAERHFRSANVQGLLDRIVGSVDVIRGTREAVFRAFHEKIVDSFK